MIALAAFFILFDISRSNNPRLFIPFIIITALAALFSVSLHYLGLVGGGDAKLLIALGAMFPFLQTSNFIMPVFFLSVFTNAVLISLLIPLIFFVLNLKHLGGVRTPRDFLRLFVAYKKDAKDLGSFEAILDEDQLFINSRKVELGKVHREGEVWVTPAFPFVVFLTVGYLISIFYGDLLSFIF
jgi:preflagellin peptidase FlaK